MSFEETTTTNREMIMESSIPKEYEEETLLKSPQRKRLRAEESESEDVDVERESDYDDNDGEEEDDDEKLYCLCRQKDDGKFMISCEDCGEWFHGRCVKMTKEKAKQYQEWFCPNCVKKKENSDKAAMNNKAEPIRKKRKSGGGAAVAETEETAMFDQVRNRVRQGIQKVLENGHKTLLDLNKSSSSDGVKHFALPDEIFAQIPDIARQIESEMYKFLRGEAYKEKFRTLHFNLKDSNNVGNVLCGNVTPDRLVVMTAEDLANEHLKNIKKAVQEESLQNSVITEAMAQVILKKTHKGEVAVDKSQLSVNTEVEALNNVININTPVILQGPEFSPATQIPPPTTINEDSPMVVDTPVKPANAITETMIEKESITEKVNSNSSGSSLDALLAKVKSDGVSVHSVSTVESVIVKEDDNKEVQLKDKDEGDENRWKEPEFLSNESRIWTGKLDGIECHAKHVGGSDIDFPLTWTSILPLTMTVAGRISHESVYKYLKEQSHSDHCKLLFVLFEPSSDDSVHKYHQFWQHYHLKQRYAVVKCSMPGVKDMYILPLSKHGQLPEVIDSLGHCLPHDDRRVDLLLGVVIYSVANNNISSPKNTASVSNGINGVKSVPDVTSALCVLGNLGSLLPAAPTIQRPTPSQHQQQHQQQHFYPQVPINPYMPQFIQHPYGSINYTKVSPVAPQHHNHHQYHNNPPQRPYHSQARGHRGSQPPRPHLRNHTNNYSMHNSNNRRGGSGGYH